MKKFFSLVLALVMALSLTTVAWGANPTTLPTGTVVDGVTVITLTSDVDLADAVVVDGASVKIEAPVPGYTIDTSAVVDAFQVKNGGTLTLGANVTITSNKAVLWANGGTIIIDGATLKGTNTAHALAAVENSGVITVKSGKVSSTGTNKTTMDIFGTGGTINVEGGEVYSGDSSAISIGGTNGGTINISGGTVTTNCAGLPAAVFGYSGTINVSGGTVKNVNPANTYPSLIASSNSCTPATVNVSGGNIQKVGILNDATAANMNVEGGTFEVAPADAYLNGLTYTQNTAGQYVVGAPVAFANKYDLYLADKTMNAMLALEKPAVSGLAFNEVGANTNLDGSGNVAYIVANNGEYYVKTTTPYTTSYAVTYAGKTDVLYYVDVAAVQNASAFAYAGSATAFDKFSTFDKCGYATVTPAATDVYFQTAAGAALNVAYKAAATVGTDVTKNYLLNGEIVTVADDVAVVDHKFVASGYKYDTVKKINVPTSALCTKCLETSSLIYKDKTVPAGTKYYELWDGNNTTDYSVVVATPSIGGTVVTPGTLVESAETFDAGIAMYVGMSVMAAAGSVVVLKKRED